MHLDTSALASSQQVDPTPESPEATFFLLGEVGGVGVEAFEATDSASIDGGSSEVRGGSGM